MRQHNEITANDEKTIRGVLEAHQASEDAAVAAAAEMEQWKAIRKTAEEMYDLLQAPDDDTPYTKGGRAVTILFQTVPGPERKIERSAHKIAQLRESLRESAMRAGGPERLATNIAMAQELAKEFSRTLVVDPDLKGGIPCIRDYRITVFDILEMLIAGHSSDEILNREKDLNETDIADCIQFGIRLGEMTRELSQE